MTAKESNYTISDSVGTLAVTAQSIVPDPQNPESYLGVVVDSPSDQVYTGLEHKWIPSVTGNDGKALVEGADYEVTYGTADFTNVTGDIVVTIKGKGNYSGEVVRSYKITPAPYSVTTESATKVYDGTALTAPGKIDGLLEGETADLKVTGSQTKVGASENTYTIEWTGTAKESNYKLESENIGTLTVTEAPDSPTPDDQSKDQGIFNGNGAGLVQTGDATGICGMAAVIAAVVAAFVSLLAVRRRKK